MLVPSARRKQGPALPRTLPAPSMGTTCQKITIDETTSFSVPPGPQLWILKLLRLAVRVPPMISALIRVAALRNAAFTASAIAGSVAGPYWRRSTM